MFDIRLLAKPGWTHLPKLGSRLAYLLCRYAALLYLVLAIVFLSEFKSLCTCTSPSSVLMHIRDPLLPTATPGLHCSSWARGLNVMSMLSLDAVDFIFVQRTLALYSWDKKVMIPLVALYVITAGMSVPAIVWFGYGYNIPDGRGGVVDFCAYQTYRFATSHFPVFIVYKSFAVILDTSVSPGCAASDSNPLRAQTLTHLKPCPP